MNKKNIIIIGIDALRAKNLGCYGYTHSTSPNIDKLAKRGILFKNAYSCINTTDASLTTILSGKYPASHGIIAHDRWITAGQRKKLNEGGLEFLPEILRKAGYTTIDLTGRGNLGATWLNRGYDYIDPLQESKTKKSINRILGNPRASGNVEVSSGLIYSTLKNIYDIKAEIHEEINMGKIRKNSEKVINKAINLIEDCKEKQFFMVLFCTDTHEPYNAPPEYIRETSKCGMKTKEVLNQIYVPWAKKLCRWNVMYDKYVSEVIARYDGAIAFTDYQIGRLMEALKKNEILDNTLILLTADHGESLTEHEIFFEHHGLYDVSIHIPLIIVHPSFPNKSIDSFVQHSDITPTIIDFLNLKNDDFDGKSMLPLINDNKEIHSAVYAEEGTYSHRRCIRTKKYKYIYALSREDVMCKRCGRTHGDIEELYDLEEDPTEVKNIVSDNRGIADGLKKQVSKKFESIR